MDSFRNGKDESGLGESKLTIANLKHLKNYSTKNTRSKSNETTKGLFNVRASFFLVLWYLFSGCTLFLNKYILSYMNGDPTVLGEYEPVI